MSVKSYTIIRYFYAADFDRWLNLEARGRIGQNQQVLLNNYRTIKNGHPNMIGMTVLTADWEKKFSPILLP